MKNVVLFEQQGVFGSRFAAFFNRREEQPCRIQLFTDRDRLESFSEGRRIDLLIYDEKERDLVRDIPAAGRLMLGSGRSAPEPGEKAVCRYQSAETLQEEVIRALSLCGEKEAVSGGKARVYGVFSQESFLEADLFSLLLGQAIAVHRSVLHVGLSELPGLVSLLEDRPDMGLSDALYFQEQGVLAQKVPGIVGHWHGLAYLQGAACPEDIRDFGSDAAAGLTEKLASCGLYDDIVLDFGSSAAEVMPLLPLCDKIFAAGSDCPLGQMRLEHFLEWLDSCLAPYGAGEPVIYSLPKVQVSLPAGLWLEEQLWGKAGTAVKELACREGVIRAV